MSDSSLSSAKRKREDAPVAGAGVNGSPAAAAGVDGTAATSAIASGEPAPKKKRRWDTAPETTNQATLSTNIAPSAPAASPPPTATATAATAVATKPLTAAEKAAALQKSIADRLAALKVPKPPAAPAQAPSAVKVDPSHYFPSPTVTVKPESSSSWVPLRFDSLGRPLDANGQLIVQQRTMDLKINMKGQAAAAAAAVGADKKLAHAKISTTIYKEEGQSKFFDPRMRESGPQERKARPMEFVKPGKYIQQAATLRMKQLEKDMMDAAEAAAKEAKSASSASAHTAITILKPPTAIPTVEWWDAKLLKDASNGYPSVSSYDDVVNWDRVTSYVYHPVELSSLTDAPPPPPMPVLLTQKERAKIKKRTKREEQKEQRDRIRLGIDAPPEPKMRIQNLMNVLLNDTVADPSMMEAKVRAQMKQRVDGHLEANAARKLTAEQKAEKRRRKYLEDTSHEVHVAVYRAGELSDGKARYSIDVNASQWNLGGVALVHPDCSVVIVEGGPKNLRRFKNLMLNRIRWKRKKKKAMELAEEGGKGEGGEEDHEEDDDDDDDDSDSDDDSIVATRDDQTTRSRTGACALLWSGIIPKTRFQGQRFTFESQRSEAMARNYLARMGMENYWDMARAYNQGTEL